MSKILDEYDAKSIQRRYFIKSVAKFGAILLCVICVGIYAGNIFFGDRSLETLIFLQNKKEAMNKDFEALKSENAKLQKEYFELKTFEPNFKVKK